MAFPSMAAYLAATGQGPPVPVPVPQSAPVRLVSAFSSSSGDFNVIINTGKLAPNSLRYNELRTYLERKRNSSPPSSLFVIDDSVIDVNTVSIMLQPAVAAGRLCKSRIGQGYVPNSVAQCDFLIVFYSRSPDNKPEINGFSSVLYNSHYNYRGLSNQLFFEIDLICADTQVNGPGTYIMDFLKSIINDTYKRDIAQPVGSANLAFAQNSKEWYGIFLKSIPSADTQAFYVKRNFRLLPSGPGADGLIPYYWYIVDNPGEVPHLDIFYRTSNKLPYKNKVLSQNAMEWEGKKQKRRSYKRSYKL